jgi:hypothetical protein
MRSLLAATMVAALVPAIAAAADPIPDMVGTWIGTTKSVVFGNNRFHPGDQKPADPPRVGEFEYTLEVTGQDGPVFWGEAWSSADPEARDTLALAIAGDGRTIVGADNDGIHTMTLVSPDRIERCYAHAGTSPSGSIVAACGFYERAK